MIARVEPGLLRGTALPPASKSHLHRLLIAAALSDKPVQIESHGMNRDIEATIACLRALGAVIDLTDTGISVDPIRREIVEPVTLPCGESGSTLRFLLPVAAALGAKAHFTGEGRLPQRPNSILTDALSAHGTSVSGDLLPIDLSGGLRGGTYAISGAVSSQYITGLLFALPLCREDSVIHLTEPLASSAYVDMTIDALGAFGIAITPVEDGWRIPGGQRYVSPGAIRAEGDWSSACFWLAANKLGSAVECAGLNPASLQGDRLFSEQLDALDGVIDVTDTPDTVPALAVAAALTPGITRITGAGRLRLKESDRLEAVSSLLCALGGKVTVLEDGLEITGVSRLSGGHVSGQNDHRIVMAAAIAATRAEGPVEITDAQAVEKSYPTFFETFNTLGGHVHVE